MIARVQALTALEFDVAAVRSNTKPNIGGVVVDSTQGWPVDYLFPHYRAILSPVIFIMAISATVKMQQKSTSTNECIGA
jgi:hypothetical protein